MILRRRRLWFVVLVGLVLAGGLWAWAIVAAISTKDGYRLTEGMTRDQVTAVIGRPPDNTSRVDRPFSGNGRYVCIDKWMAIDGDFSVYYGPDFKVYACLISDEGFFACQWKRLRTMFGY